MGPAFVALILVCSFNIWRQSGLILAIDTLIPDAAGIYT
jgi:hypothetical protein